MICLGLDVGSSSVKGAVLDLESGEVRSIVRQPFPAPLTGLPAGYFEVDPQSILHAVRDVIDGLLSQAPDAGAIFFAGQMGGTILVDQTGRPLTNYLSWRDQRTLALRPAGGTTLDALKSRWADNELAELGNELQPGSTSSLLFWLAQENLLPDQAIPATVADFVIGQLCQTLPQMDPTHAIGLLDLGAGTWHRSAFEKLGLERVCWPQLADYRVAVGSLPFQGRDIPCHASFGDQQCALKGVALTRDELSLNISTGSQVSQRTATFQPGPYQSRFFFDGDYLNTITHLPAGRSLNVLVDLLTELAQAEGLTVTRPWETIAQRAAEAQGGGLNMNLAFFAGPLGHTGSLSGITTENLSLGNVFHAAFSNMADNYLVCADRLNPQRGGRPLAISGGLTRSVPVLRQLILERFGVPIRESAEAEETLIGLLEIGRAVYGR